MAAPTRNQVLVATAAMRSEATVWDGCKDLLGEVVRVARSTRMSHYRAGLFYQWFVGDYQALVDSVAGRCEGGVTEMTNVAATLRRCAHDYETEDQIDRDQAGRLTRTRY